MTLRPARRTGQRFRAVRARRFLAVLGLGLLVVATGARAADYRSVGVAAAILYDGPSVKGRKLFVAPRGMPVEVLSEVNQWVKVREQGGDVLWIEKKDLSVTRSPVATANMIVRTAPQETAQVALQLERGVPLTSVEGTVPAGWLRVRLPDGTQGFVRAGDVWGL